MTLDHPVWTFAPNWENGITERLEWLTDMLVSRAGAEQRRSMRLSPRRFFQGTFLLTGRERQAHDVQTFMAGGIDMYVPLWTEVVHLTAPLAAGSTSIPIDPVDREFRNGDYVLLRKDAFTYEVVKIDTIAGGSLQLIANTQQTWGLGTAVYPLRLSRFDEQPQYTKHTDAFIELSAQFRLSETNDNAANPTLPSYQGFPVINTRPDESDDLTHGYARKMLTLDNQVGIPKYTDMAGLGFTTQQYRWVIVGRPAYAEFRRLLYMLRGRWKAFWMPTFMQDMRASQDITSGDNFLRIYEMGYTEFGGAVKGRNHIRIELTDGTCIYKEITSSAPIGVGEERLALTDTFSANIPAASIRSISYMALSLLDADAIEIGHETDGDGLTICTVSTASAPDLRNATEWNVPAILAYTGTPLGCLPPCGPVIKASWRSTNIKQNGWSLNPDTHEIWVPFGSGILSAGSVTIGQRWATDDSAAILGNVTVPHGIGSVFDSDFNSYDVPGFIYVPAPVKRMYFSGSGSEFNHRQLAAFDSETGAYLAGRDVTFEMPSHDTIQLEYTSGDLVAFVNNFANFEIYSIDQSTLAPTFVTSVININYKHGTPVVGPDGGIYFTMSDGTPSNPSLYSRQVYRYKNGVVNYVFTYPVAIAKIIPDPDHGTLWIMEDSSVTGYLCREVALDGTATGRTLTPGFFGSYSGYDSRNHWMWGAGYVDEGAGYFIRLSAVDTNTGTTVKIMDYHTDPLITGSSNNTLFPSAGTPNALYFAGLFYDPTIPQYYTALVKAPVCQARNP